MAYRCIEAEDVPRLYGLSWTSHPEQLVVKIHKDVVRRLPFVSSAAPMVRSFQGEFGFEKFVGDVRQNFGFDDALYPVGEIDDFFACRRSSRLLEWRIGTRHILFQQA